MQELNLLTLLLKKERAQLLNLNFLSKGCTKIFLNNYFFLNRFVVENYSLLYNCRVKNIFTQEKDELIFTLVKDNNEIFLIISVNPSSPFIIIKDEFHRAKKNTIDFFESYIPAEIKNFQIAKTDRVINITLTSGNIYFIIRGKFTNICFIDKSKTISFFKNYLGESEKDLIDEITSLTFTNEINLPSFSLKIEEDSPEKLKHDYPFLCKEIINEVIVRLKQGEKNEIVNCLISTINDIIKGKIIISFNDKAGIIDFYPENFRHEERSNYLKFEDINSAIIFYLNKKFYFESFLDRKKRIQKFLEKEMDKVSKKLNKLKTEIEKGSKEKEFSQIANVLLINRNKLKTGINFIELEDIYNPGNIIKINLDEKLTPQRNIDLYFEKSRNEKIKIVKSKLLFSNFEKIFYNLKRIKEKTALTDKIDELKDIMKELKMKDQETKTDNEDIRSKFKQYIIEEKYYLFIGKDSMNNDLLTTRFAKQNDYWFHARNVPGSHVVLRVNNVKESVPKNILKKAASIAAFHSKAKTAGVVPVSFTLKKYVIKKKNMEPGKVALLKEDVLLVKPEIPAGCEFISNDEK